MDVVPLQFSVIGYLLASGGYAAGIMRSGDWARRGGPLFLVVAFLLHTAFMLLRAAAVGIPATSFTEGSAFFSWLMVGAYLLVQVRYKISVVGAIVSALAFVLTFGAYAFYSGSDGAVEPLASPWLSLHVILAFLGNAVFGLAFAVSCVYLLQEHLLKSHGRGSIIRRLPALEKLDRTNQLFLIWGFPLLTLGILTGGIWAASTSGSFWSWEPREVFSVATWLLYAALLQFRMLGGLGGRQVARLTILGFGLLSVSYLAVNLLPLSGRHGAGPTL